MSVVELAADARLPMAGFAGLSFLTLRLIKFGTDLSLGVPSGTGTMYEIDVGLYK
jgi:hypothetical protein